MNNINQMLEVVSKKLGISQEKLKEALQSGDISKALSNMPKKDADKLTAILNNPEAIKKAMNSKQAQEIKNTIRKN